MKNPIRLGSAPLLLLLLAPSLLWGQSEDALAHYFLGKTVALKMDMPATKDGVDVYPGRQPDIIFNQYSQRLKRFGTSLHSGDTSQVTTIKVKDKLVEFQLGGGGYGTAGDEADTPIQYTPTPKSGRERDLERDIKTETDAHRKRDMQDELDDLRRDRAREDSRLQAAANLAEEQRRQRIFLRAQQSGSRFNIRYPEGVVVERLTPEVVMQALAPYVDFSPAPGAAPPPAATPTYPQIAPAPDPAGIHKGMLENEVDALLGRPVEVHQGKEGSLDVSRSTYQQGENVVEALFVEGVLVRYTISSK